MMKARENKKNKPLIILAGPTGVGKTHLSISLAKRTGAEIISADSIQVYRGMDIGSAKITKEEMSGVRHHLIDVLEPWEDFHVAKFQQMAKKAMEEIYKQGKIPLLVGGTGFYIQALLKDIDFQKEEEDVSYRLQLEQVLKEEGAKALHEKLEKIDPASAEGIHYNNHKRVIRALEYYHIHKSPISLHNEEEKKRKSPYNFLYFVLTDKRDRLYKNINDRVDKMFDEGLIEEVRGLKERGCGRNLVSMQGLGYKEILDYLEGQLSLEQAREVLKRDTRHFAKRQLTWFRREEQAFWIEKSSFAYDENAMVEAMVQMCLEKGIKTNGQTVQGRNI